MNFFSRPFAISPSIIIMADSDTLVVDAEHLSIKTIRAGDGKTFPKVGAKLKMHYTGTITATGDKFDSSRDRGKAFECTIGVGRLIKGWDEGVPKMSLGQRAILTISSDWGYGAGGHPPKIPPAAGLTFDVELLQIQDEATGKWLRAYTDEEKALFRSKLEEWAAGKLKKFDADEGFRELRVGKYGDRAGFEAFLNESVEKKMLAVQ